MARRHHRRHTTHRHHRRRHSVGAINVGGWQKAVLAVLGAGAGFAGARLASTYITQLNPKLMGGAEIALGTIAAIKLRNPVMKAVGIGFGAGGAVTLLGQQGFKILPASIGYGPDPMHRLPYGSMSGFRDVPKVGNFPQPGAIGFPQPGNIGAMDRDRMRMTRAYAGIYR